MLLSICLFSIKRVTLSSEQHNLTQKSSLVYFQFSRHGELDELDVKWIKGDDFVAAGLKEELLTLYLKCLWKRRPFDLKVVWSIVCGVWKPCDRCSGRLRLVTHHFSSVPPFKCQFLSHHWFSSLVKAISHPAVCDLRAPLCLLVCGVGVGKRWSLVLV